MKYLFLARAVRNNFSPEQLLGMIKAIGDWHDRRIKDGTFDCIYNFIDGGGIAIANIDSPEAAWDLFGEYPGRLLFDWEIFPLVDAKHANDSARSRIEKAVGRK